MNANPKKPLATRLTIALLLAALLVLPAARALGGGMLTGKWTVTLSSIEGTGQDIEDTLSFDKTKFSSEYFGNKGFAGTEFKGVETPLVGALAKFSATASSDSDGKLAWQGSITASAIEGTVTWTKKDGSEVTYRFTGKRQ